MILSSIRFYEGNNIKRTKKVVKINIEEAERVLIYKYVSGYFKASFLLGFNEKLIDIQINKYAEIWVTYTQEQVAKSLLKNLFYHKDINECVTKSLKLVKDGLIEEIKENAEKFDIPYVNLTENMIQLGYGKNSVIIGKQYQSFENMNNVLMSEDRHVLFSQLKYNNISMCKSNIVYCKEEINTSKFPIIIKGINKHNDFSIYIRDKRELNEKIETILSKYGAIACFYGEVYYKIICIKGKAKAVFKLSVQSKCIQEVSIDKNVENICSKIYDQFKIKFMYIYVTRENDLKVADIGSLFSKPIYKLIQTKVAETILASLKDEGVGFIPIVSVTGTNGKTSTSRVIHHLLNELEFKTGLTCTGGIFLGNSRIKSGDTTGFLSAREVIKNNAVEAAVFETARGGICRNGLGYDGAKVAVVTSLSEDHIGMDGIRNIEDLINIKSVILSEVKKDGKLVLRAKKEIVLEYYRIKNNIDVNNVCLFDISPNLYIDEHIKNGGEAFYLENKFIIHCKDGIQNNIISIDEIPFAFNGISKGNLLNIIAAIAAVSAVCSNTEKIISVLRRLRCDMYTNPGRQNLLEIRNFRLILDYGHNSEAFEEVFNLAKQLNKTKIISIVAAPGDRPDKYIKQLGILSAKNSDYVIIREQSDLRGRKKGESATLIKQGLIEAGMEQGKFEIIYKEEDALAYAMENVKEGDVIVLFTQCLDVIMPVINKFLVSKGEKPIYEDIDFQH